MSLNIRTQINRISAHSANLYHRALRYTGIADCTEMRVTAAVAVCVVAWYIICIVAWVADALQQGAALTAHITQ